MIRLFIFLWLIAGIQLSVMANPITGPRLDQVKQPPFGIGLSDEQLNLNPYNAAERHLQDKERSQRLINQRNAAIYHGHDPGSAYELQQIQRDEGHHLDK